MFYSVLRFFIRWGLKWYAPRLITKDLYLATYTYPSIIISNHPNSLFDALVIVAYAPAKVCFLTRGDIFKHPVANVVLRGLNMLPIYKRNQDADYAVKNDFTFDECMRRLAAGEHILIFPEGRSRNLWTLQPFMNGGLTSLLERAYKAELPLQIQSYTLNYSSFRYVPKAVELTALPPVDSTEYIVEHRVQAAEVIKEVRSNLHREMTEEPLMPDEAVSRYGQLWRVPAKVGYYTQFWFSRLWRDYIRKKTEGTIFYDSLLFSVLLLSYPFCVLLFSLIVGKFAGFWIGLFVFIFLPFTTYFLARNQPIVVETETDIPKRNSWNDQSESPEDGENSD